MPEKHYLRQMQALPLRAKVRMSEQRIMEWYQHFNGDVCISFSGGKDSTVLAALVHEWYPNVPLVFCNTGLEYPEIQSFARKMGAEFVRPKMMFSEVISKYGYPIISKENAEAIYYARKIRNSVGGGTDPIPYRSSKRCWAGDSTTESGYQRNPDQLGTAGTEQAQQIIGGGYFTEPVSGSDRMAPGGTDGPDSFQNNWGGYQPRNAENSTVRAEFPWGGYDRLSQETLGTDGDEERVRSPEDGRDWIGWRRNCIAGVGAFAEEKPSLFNKKKWLPLCQETQFMISHMCCGVMKKAPIKAYQKKSHLYPYIGTLTEESKLREQAWVKHGCNAFDAANKTSQPMSFWTEQDVLHYIWDEGLEIASVYGDIVAVDDNGLEYEPPFFASSCNLKCTGCQRTGCIFCGFGLHLEKGETRFQKLAKTHPKQYEYCMNGGQWVDNPHYDPVAPEYDGEWKNWNPKKIWVPSKEGLGMRKVFEDCNQIYGKDFIRYE